MCRAKFSFKVLKSCFRPKKDDPFASLGALTGIAPKAAPAKAPTMNQQQQNQFNNYMQNNVGAPAAPSVSSMQKSALSLSLEQQFNGYFWLRGWKQCHCTIVDYSRSRTHNIVKCYRTNKCLRNVTKLVQCAGFSGVRRLRSINEPIWLQNLPF